MKVDRIYYYTVAGVASSRTVAEVARDGSGGVGGGGGWRVEQHLVGWDWDLRGV